MKGNRWAYPLFNAMLVLSLPVIGGAIFLRWHRRILSKGGDRWAERWGNIPEALRGHFGKGRWWWVHAVSMGEVKAIESFLRQAPHVTGVRILLTAVTPEALDWATERKIADAIL